jgi:hypothetical protein
MAREYMEAFVKLRPVNHAGHAQGWFGQQGLSVLPIQAGLLISGSAEAFKRVFGCDVTTLRRPARLQPPAPVADEVELVEIPRPRYPMSGHPSP